MKREGENLVFSLDEARYIFINYNHIDYPDRDALRDFGNAVLDSYRIRNETDDEIKIANNPDQRHFIAKLILGSGILQ
jgi:hypothetical protein